MSNNGHYMIKIYKDKFLQKSYSTTQETFGKYHTALMKLAKEEHDLNFSFGFDGVDTYIGMYRDVADKLFRYIEDSCKKEMQQPTSNSDAVEHPTHYTSHPSGIECIEITRHYCFSIGNAIKYLWRAGLKQDADKTSKQKEIEDLRKAVWYINDRIKQLEGE